MSAPLVSIVTPTYNQAAFLRETIDSVLAQDYPSIEYVVLDDGSTDQTPRILEAYGDRIRWTSHPNQGQTPTINKGWALAGGEVLAWLNSDDTLLPGAVATAVRYLEARPEVGIVFGDTLFTDAAGKALSRSPARSRFDYERFVVECENPIPQPSAFVRRAVISDVGPLDPHYYYFMDWDYWLRAGIRHRIAYIPELLSTYRLHEGSKTVSKAAQVAPELEYMYAGYFNRGDVPRPVHRRRRRAMANMCFTSAGYYLEGGRPAEARRLGLRALRTYPGLLARPAMVHKLVYCIAGSSRAYARARALLRRRLRPE